MEYPRAINPYMAPWVTPEMMSPQNWAPVRPVASGLAHWAKGLSVLIS